MKLIGVVHQLSGTENHELHYTYVNVDHIVYMTKFLSGDIKTQLVLTNGEALYSTQDITELQRESSVRVESSTSSPFLL